MAAPQIYPDDGGSLRASPWDALSLAKALRDVYQLPDIVDGLPWDEMGLREQKYWLDRAVKVSNAYAKYMRWPASDILAREG